MNIKKTAVSLVFALILLSLTVFPTQSAQAGYASLSIRRQVLQELQMLRWQRLLLSEYPSLEKIENEEEGYLILNIPDISTDEMITTISQVSGILQSVEYHADTQELSIQVPYRFSLPSDESLQTLEEQIEALQDEIEEITSTEDAPLPAISEEIMDHVPRYNSDFSDNEIDLN